MWAKCDIRQCQSWFLWHGQLIVFLLPLDGMLVHHRVTPAINFASTHLYKWVERGNVGVKCLAQEHNAIISPARARLQTALSGGEGTKHRSPHLQGCYSTVWKLLFQSNNFDKRSGWKNVSVLLWRLMTNDLGFKQHGYWCEYGRWVP